MKEEQEEKSVEQGDDERYFDPEITDLGNLINTILDYYSFSQTEDGEEWKKGTDLEHKMIPEDVNKLVEQAFKAQLKKFIKK